MDEILQEPLADAKFRIQNGATRGAANGIMTEQHEFVAEDGTGTQATNRNSHASAGIPVAQRLRPVVFSAVDQSMLWRAGQLESLRLGCVVYPCGDDVLFACIGA